MIQEDEITTKQNVDRFNEDVRRSGSYTYTDERLSARFANARITSAIAESYNFSGKAVLDLGCGDGTYTLEFAALNVREVLGIDPAAAAIEAAGSSAAKLGLDKIIRFEVGNIYALESLIESQRFDCIVIRGVLHHLPDPARALAGLTKFKGTVVVLEPNGNNPVLKLLEKYSRYHIEHEERSFSPTLIESWLCTANFRIRTSKVLNLVPFFCPDWMARILRLVEPLVERLPLLRNIACGQCIVVAQK